MLSDEELATMIRAAFRDVLPPSALERLTFEKGEDHDGDPAIFIAIRGAKADESGLTLALLEATSRLRRELWRRGDGRLPYLHHENEESTHERVS